MEGPEIKFAEAVIDNGKYGKRTLRFETGRLAQQAAGAAVVYLDDETMLFSATTASKTPKDHFDFFPLTIDVEERMYAAGKIPGSFFRREGRPSTAAILACRLIDRPLRPSFVDGLRNEIQVVVTVMSIEPDELYDVVAINAASMSTQLAGLPFSGPVAGVRVALIEGQWVAFPKHSQLVNAVFNMVVAGRVMDGDDVAIMMVEAEATENSWDLIAGGAVAPNEEVVSRSGGCKLSSELSCSNELATQLPATADYPVFLPYSAEFLLLLKQARVPRLQRSTRLLTSRSVRMLTTPSKARVKEELVAKLSEDDMAQFSAAYKAVAKKAMRTRVLKEGVRIDGRGLADIRLIDSEVGVIPRTHGSAIFQRGETQILGVTTLNMLKMEQQLDALTPEKSKRYMHHYNFPPYSTGETGRVGTPKRREIGHGALAERALMPVLPARDEFPYAIRQVSEALSSNGSTSMGSVCASTLALLNAGVPLRAPVAGIAMGLISDTVDGKTQYAALTDILGAEDALGDMDFKVAGTRNFVTAIQLDTKLDGIPSSELAKALTQAKEARLFILDVMAEAIDEPDELSKYSPRVIAVKIPLDKIGEVIGPKGKMINQIQDDTGADISIEDDGTVYIGAVDGPSADAAKAAINAIANPHIPEIGERFLGTVVKLATFGAFISLMPGKDGLLHVSELKKISGGKRVENVEDILSVGQKILVEITKTDDRGKLSLSPVVEDEPASE